MIKIIIARITYEGLFFEGEEPVSIADKEEKLRFVPLEGIKYKLKASLINNAVIVTGEANITLKCICDKCLSEFELNICNNNICHLYEKEDSSEIDLTEDIREDILINLPYRLLCRKNCKGLCFKCGQDLNIKKCFCTGHNSSDPAWNELNKLEF